MVDYQLMEESSLTAIQQVGSMYRTVEDIGDGYFKVSKRIDCIIVYNIISPKGTELSNVWYEWIGDFQDGKAIVLENGKYNIITKHAKKIFTSSRTYKSMEYKGNGIYLIQNRQGKYNLLGKDNKLIGDNWFDDITSITSQGAVVIQHVTRGKNLEKGEIEYNYNYMTSKGRLLFVKNCPKIEEYDGYIRAYFKDYSDRWYGGNEMLQRIIRIRDGRVMAQGRFKAIYEIQGGYKVIESEERIRQYNLLGKDYKPVFDEWFDDVSVFFYGVQGNNIFFAAGNKIDGKLMFRIYDEYKQLITNMYFDTLYPLNEKAGQYIMIKDGEQYKVYIREKVVTKL